MNADAYIARAHHLLAEADRFAGEDAMHLAIEAQACIAMATYLAHPIVEVLSI